jgi:hypothetical protein
MQLARFIRLWGFLLGLGLVGFQLGCSGERTAPPLQPGEGKKIAEAVKADRKEGMMERAGGKKGMRQDRTSGKGPGG